MDKEFLPETCLACDARQGNTCMISSTDLCDRAFREGENWMCGKPVDCHLDYCTEQGERKNGSN